jgi:hypothetical protein
MAAESGSEDTEPSYPRESSTEDGSVRERRLNLWNMRVGIGASIATIITLGVTVVPLVAPLLDSGPAATAQPRTGHTSSPTADTRSPTPSPATPGGSAKSSTGPGPDHAPQTPSAQSTSPQPPGGMTIQIEPDHGGISAAINVTVTGCPQGDQIDIDLDGKALFPALNCQAYREYYSYSPDQNGTLTYVAPSGSNGQFTLHPGKTYPVHAQAVHGGQTSPFVTYRVG